MLIKFNFTLIHCINIQIRKASVNSKNGNVQGHTKERINENMHRRHVVKNLKSRDAEYFIMPNVRKRFPVEAVLQKQLFNFIRTFLTVIFW